MERGSLLRWLFMGLAVFLFVTYGWPLISGEKQSGVPSELQPLGATDETAPVAEKRTAEKLCKLAGPRFSAELTSKGGSLKHVWMEGTKYTADVNGEQLPIDLVTTSRQGRMPLRTNLKSTDTDQLSYDDVDWTLGTRTATSCTFNYSDDKTTLVKTVRTTDRPFELSVALTVTNKDETPRKHRLTIEQTDWRTVEETSGSWGRVAELLTKAEVYAGGEVERLEPGDFGPSDFEEPEFTAEKWHRFPGQATWAAVSSSYFSKAVFHVNGPSEPVGEVLVEEAWNIKSFPNKDDDPNFGHIYRARLAYEVAELNKDATASYEWLAFVGPKEREVLAKVGGEGQHATELLDLGVFGAIGKLLIQYLYFLFGFTGTWGWAICLLTITVKLLLFPLSVAQIKSSYGMRKLKPEMDELNKKYKDDAQARGVAIQELWRKNKVTNPMLGCLPVALQMPVWFALYTALQTAVELYHTPFGPFIPDLSAPGLYYIIPALLGVSSFIQQRLMPMQGDATQQKLMRWMMPAIFTVMMLFLPAGLGIYFLTNTWLGIGQQLAVERYYKAREAQDEAQAAADASDEDEESDAKSPSLRKGKARA